MTGMPWRGVVGMWLALSLLTVLIIAENGSALGQHKSTNISSYLEVQLSHGEGVSMICKLHDLIVMHIVVKGCRCQEGIFTNKPCRQMHRSSNVMV